MQFSYQISETDFQKARKLCVKIAYGSKAAKQIMFWVFIIICLMLLWAVVQKSNHEPTRPAGTDDAAVVNDSERPPPRPSNITNDLLMNVGPFVLIGGIWAFMLFRMVPRAARKLYWNNPLMQGRFTVEITPDFIAIQNTVGFTSRSGWIMYEYWNEGKDLIVLGMRSQAFFPIALGELAPGQRDELRAILSTALPRK